MKKRLNRISRWLRFNSRYLGHPPWDSGISPPELLDFIEQTKPGRALDLGCGTGTNLLALAQAGWRVEGVEFALIAVLKARRKLAVYQDAARVYTGGVTDIDYLSGPYDLILDIGCYHSLSSAERSRYRQNVRRLLAQGGTLLMYGFLQTEGVQVGIQEDEIVKFAEQMTLVSRQNGVDHGKRVSVWLRFDRKDE